MGLERCRLLEFPKVFDSRGSLTFVEETRHVPFQIRRVFYVYDVPRGGTRGAHAHKTLQQVIVCLAGGLEVALDDGHQRRGIRLDRPWLGLYIPPMIWAAEGDFEQGTVYMVLASDLYDESDYHRDYEAFLEAAKQHGQ
ncbi:MAG: sugar 3,4-ketoisomerase [bacterium]